MASTVKIPRLDVVAECLSGMERYENYVIKYHDDIYDYDVNIISPAFYCVHKIVINSKRKEDKKMKDAIAIKNILKLIESNADLSVQFIRVKSELTKNELKAFNENIINLGIIDLVNNITK